MNVITALFTLGYLFIGVILLALLGLLNAMCLRLAIAILKCPKIDFLNSYIIVTVSSFTSIMFFLSTQAISLFGRSYLEVRAGNRGVFYQDISSLYLVCCLVLSLLASAIFLRRLRPHSDSSQLSFSDAFGLIAFYKAISYFVIGVLGMILYAIIIGFVTLFWGY
ncbi:MAG: hypothetical protein J0M26_11885 [Planctomycetes bacterium]|nr:hypothetical protein [Planctomycetota bacterium]